MQIPASSRPAASYYVLMATRLEVRNLTVELPMQSGWVRPVNEVSFVLDEAETLGIVGESGSGKTMLSLALMGLEPPGARRKGEAWLHERDSTADIRGINLLAASSREMRALRGREIAMIFQEPMTALNPVVRVGAQIEEAIRVHENRPNQNEIHSRAIQIARTSRFSRSKTPRAAIPSSAFRGLASTCDDRDGVGRRSGNSNCG